MPEWLPTFGFAVLVSPFGWLAGWISARVTEVLVARADSMEIARADPEESLITRSEHGLANLPRPGHLTPDPLVQGAVSALWFGLMLFHGPSVEWLAAALLVVPLVQVAVTDMRYRYVYDAIALAGIVLGSALSPLLFGSPWWISPVAAVGAYVAFGAIWAIGRLLYRGMEPMASGDVKIAAMVGASAGPFVVTALVAGVLFSGLIALGTLIAARTGRAMMPYGPGLCLGGLLVIMIS